MNAPTSVVPAGTGVIAHVSDGPVYTAPAAHAFAVAPAAHYLPLAPAGHVYIAPAEQSSGIGITVDHQS